MARGTNAFRQPDVGIEHAQLQRPRPVMRRGLSRVDAAQYVGISPSKFDELVEDGRMPRPRRIDKRKLWDVVELDLAFDALPRDDDRDDDQAADDWKVAV